MVFLVETPDLMFEWSCFLLWSLAKLTISNTPQLIEACSTEILECQKLQSCGDDQFLWHDHLGLLLEKHSEGNDKNKDKSLEAVLLALVMTVRVDINTSSGGTRKSFDSKQAVPSELRESRPH